MTEFNSKDTSVSIQPKRSTKKKTLEQFVVEAKAVHGDKYDYSESIYAGVESKIPIICPIHGKFEQKAKRHLAGMGCLRCSSKAKLNKQGFVEKSREIHGDRYDYTDTVYLKSTEKVSIRCPKHGVFSQRASAHMGGQGCPACFKTPLSKRSYQSYCNEKHSGLSNIYVIRCQSHDGEESFIKVGLSAFGVDKRFSCDSKMPYKVETILIVSGKAGLAWDTEKLIHKASKKHRYFPKKGFGGMGECYLDEEDVLNKIQSILTRLNE